MRILSITKKNKRKNTVNNNKDSQICQMNKYTRNYVKKDLQFLCEFLSELPDLFIFLTFWTVESIMNMNICCGKIKILILASAKLNWKWQNVKLELVKIDENRLMKYSVCCTTLRSCARLPLKITVWQLIKVFLLLVTSMRSTRWTKITRFT